MESMSEKTKESLRIYLGALILKKFFINSSLDEFLNLSQSEYSRNDFLALELLRAFNYIFLEKEILPLGCLAVWWFYKFKDSDLLGDRVILGYGKKVSPAFTSPEYRKLTDYINSLSSEIQLEAQLKKVLSWKDDGKRRGKRMLFTENRTTIGVRELFVGKIEICLPDLDDEEKEQMIRDTGNKGLAMDYLVKLSVQNFRFWYFLYRERNTSKNLDNIAAIYQISVAELKKFIEDHYERITTITRQVLGQGFLYDPVGRHYPALLQEKEDLRIRTERMIVSQFSELTQILFPNWKSLKWYEKTSATVLLASLVTVFQNLGEECFGLWKIERTVPMSENRLEKIKEIFGEDMLRVVELRVRMRRYFELVEDSDVKRVLMGRGNSLAEAA